MTGILSLDIQGQAESCRTGAWLRSKVLSQAQTGYFEPGTNGLIFQAQFPQSEPGSAPATFSFPQ